MGKLEQSTLPIKTEPRRYVSASGLRDADKCWRLYYFNRALKEQKFMPPVFAKGIFVHAKHDEFRTKNFKSAKNWANYCWRMWNDFVVKPGEMRGMKILWPEENHKPEDDRLPSIMARQIMRICYDNYDRLKKEQENEEEHPVKFPYTDKNGKRKYKTGIFTKLRTDDNEIGFLGEIDEVWNWKSRKIRDTKTGGWKKIEQELDFAYQPTIYGFFHTQKIIKDHNYRAVVGVSDEEVQEIKDRCEYIDPEIKFEFNMVERKWEKNEKGTWEAVKKENPILKTTRNDIHFRELIDKVKDFNGTADYIEDDKCYRPSASRGDHCFYCQFQEQCWRMSSDKRIRQPEIGEYIRENPRLTFIDESDDIPIGDIKTKQRQIGYRRKKKAEDVN